MNGAQTPIISDALLGATPHVDADAATFTLAEVQRLASEKRAIAEEVLAQAREFESQLAIESESIAGLATIASRARADEVEATERLDEARMKHAEIIAKEKSVRADVEAALQMFKERQNARADAEKNLKDIRTRIELLSGTNGLSAEAVKRIVERRLADKVRQGAE